MCQHSGYTQHTESTKTIYTRWYWRWGPERSGLGVVINVRTGCVKVQEGMVRTRQIQG